jgi:hypothetical protein
MQKPNLKRLYRVWIRIGQSQPTEALFSNAARIIKSQISELVTSLQNNKMIDWYYFLIHGKNNDTNNAYFDLVFSVSEGIDFKNFVEALPTYCLDPEQVVQGFGESISDITNSQLKNNEIEEAWKIIGEQSEWVIRMLSSHNDNEITIQQYIQFMHYYMNMMGLGHHSIFLMPAPTGVVGF